MKTLRTKSAIYVTASFLWILLCLSCKGGNNGKPDAPGRNERPDGGYSIPVDPAYLITLDNATFPVNRIIVGFADNITRQQVDDLANTVNALIVGYYPSSNNYQFEIQSATNAELETVI